MAFRLRPGQQGNAPHKAVLAGLKGAACFTPLGTKGTLTVIDAKWRQMAEIALWRMTRDYQESFIAKVITASV
jgi:hypothetical protein